MSKPIIQVENLGKSYALGSKAAQHGTLQEAITGAFRSPGKRLRAMRGKAESTESEFWALRDVSFNIERGEVVGVIGRNGAGKSTLLKILSRITEPTTGRAILRGRVASLLEVGTGFHAELSGRENIYLNGSILGLSKKEIDRKFDEIVDFAEVEKFLDTPVKRYSSGMYVRLAFAVAAHLEPEILIVDEVLAVGDVQFQKKCLGKMQDVSKKDGRTVLFVSHNMAAVRNLCENAILLHDGEVVLSSPVEEAINEYIHRGAPSQTNTWRRPHCSENKDYEIQFVKCELTGSQPKHLLNLSSTIHLGSAAKPTFIAVDIFNSTGDWLMQALPSAVPFLPASTSKIELKLEVELPPLIPGTYTVGLWIGTHFSQTCDSVREVVSFHIDHSPTPNRTVPHHRDRGYIVPVSRVTVLN